MKKLVTLCVVMLLALPVQRAAAIIIDNFEEGSFGVLDNTPGGVSVIDTQTGLSSSNVLSEEREVEAMLDAGLRVEALLSESPNEDGATCIFANGSDGFIHFEYIYPATTDLTAGSQDTLVVTMGPDTEIGGTIEIQAEDSNAHRYGVTTPIIGSGSYTFPYTAFLAGVDFSLIAELLVVIDHGTNPDIS